jgi:hypothetical protein
VPRRFNIKEDGSLVNVCKVSEQVSGRDTEVKLKVIIVQGGR